MDCHESLMQRRRKKKASAAGKRPGGPGVKLDKSLPSLPPSMAETRSIDEAASETYAEAQEPSHGRSDGHGDHSRTESSPTRQPAATGKETTTLSSVPQIQSTDQLTISS